MDVITEFLYDALRIGIATTILLNEIDNRFRFKRKLIRWISGWQWLQDWLREEENE